MIWELSAIYSTFKTFSAFLLKSTDVLHLDFLTYGLQFKRAWILCGTSIKIRKASQLFLTYCLLKHILLLPKATNRMFI